MTHSLIQVCGDGSEETYRYPLTEEDRSILRAKMNDYCMEQTGMSLDDYRAQYLDEEMCSSSFPDGQTMYWDLDPITRRKQGFDSDAYEPNAEPLIIAPCWPL
ncbi:MAG: hypothetical protein ACLTLQ_09285 [[Clostridium] scindens]